MPSTRRNHGAVHEGVAHGAASESGDFDYCNECGNYHEVPVAPNCPLFAEKSKSKSKRTPRSTPGTPPPNKGVPPTMVDPEMKAIMASMASSLDQILKNTAVQANDRRRSLSAPPHERKEVDPKTTPDDPKKTPGDPSDPVMFPSPGQLAATGLPAALAQLLPYNQHFHPNRASPRCTADQPDPGP